MNAHEPFLPCPICREGHMGRCCTASMPLSIVVLEIGDGATAETVLAIQAALLRAAQQMAQHHDA